MKKFIICIASVLVLFSWASVFAWPLYSKPEFRGRVLDAETKQPIEGAVVVVLYEKWEFGGPGGGNTLPMDAKETLTDGKGEFYFPSYKTMIGPLSRESETEFIFFKPGYKSIKYVEGKKIPDEKYFAIGKDMIGKEGEIKYVDTHFVDPYPITWKGLMGIVELKKTKPNESMSCSMPYNFSEKDLPLFYKAIEEDDIMRGLLPRGGKKR